MIATTYTITTSNPTYFSIASVGCFDTGFDIINFDDNTEVTTLSSFVGNQSQSGIAGQPFVISITPNGNYTGNIFVALQGGGLTSILNFIFNNSGTTQSQMITPNSYGNVLITPASSPSITDAAPITYSVLGINEATTPTLNPYAPPTPTITFLVNLNPPVSYGQGVALNDYQSQFKSVAIPGISRTLYHGNTFTLQGIQAQYVENTYSTGIINDYTSTPLMVLSTVF